MADLTQIVNQPTRVNNILDLVLVSDVFGDSCLSHCTVNEPFATSDHNSVELSFNFPLPSYTCERFMEYRHCTFLGLNRFISAIDWNFVFASCSDINEATGALYSILHDAIARFVPVRTRKLQVVTMPEYIRKLYHYRSLL